MDGLVESKWHEDQKKLAEEHWGETFRAIGSDRVREMLLKSDSSDTINFGFPYKAFNSTTNRQWEFHPEKNFVIKWLSDDIKDRDIQLTKSSKLALNMQYIALAISIIGALAVVTNAVRPLLETGVPDASSITK